MLFRLSNVTKSYAGHEILRGVTFQVNPGEKIGLVGRNGAGKTTVFDMITGAQAPDTGDVVRSGGLRLGLLSQHVDFDENETVHIAALSAFKAIHDIESEMRELESLMATDHSDAVYSDPTDSDPESESRAVQSYSSDPCTQMNPCRSIMSFGRRSRVSRRTVSAKSRRLRYVAQFGFERYWKSKP